MKKYYLLLLILLSISSLKAYSFGKNKIQTDKTEWKKIETLHFDIYFPAGYEDFAQIATLLSEEAYYRIKDDLKKPVRSRIPIIFYQSHQDFEVTNVIAPLLNESVGGFTESSKNRVVIPFDGSYKKLEEIITHELTHAYINAVSSGFNRMLALNNLPFWFSEGFPEFQAVHGSDVYNNIFVVDLLFNHGWGNIEEIGGYFAYRLGESFLVYLEDEYGRQSVVDLYYALRYQSTSKDAFENVFHKKFEIVQKEWVNYLKRKYYPAFADYQIPYEGLIRKTDHQKDGSRLNYAPRFSPDGNHIIYFSDKNLRTDIYKASPLGLYKNKRILSGESSAKFEEFHFQNNNLSWFPDSKSFAFVSKTSIGDKIYVMDIIDEKIINEYSFSDFDAIYEIDVDSSGEKIVFSGQKDFQTDIYIFDIAANETIRLTNDKFYNATPRWADDNFKIVFSSERNFKKGNMGIFAGVSSDIYYYDLEMEEYFQVTFDKDINNTHPIWHDDQILFSSEREFTINYDILDLENSKRAEVTNIHEGVFTADITSDGTELVASVYFEEGWNIYLKSNPLDSLEYSDYRKVEKVEFTEDFNEIFKLDNYKLFGKRLRKFKKELPEYPDEFSTIDPFNYTKVDSTIKEYNIKLDEKPIDEILPRIFDYRTKFGIDYIWGGAAYSPSVGTYAQLQLGLSDLMGNHVIGLNLGITGNLERSDFVVSYLNLAGRIDYGWGGFQLYDERIYMVPYEDPIYFREREREFGIYSILRYPFNKFWRVDLENVFTKVIIYRDGWDGQDWIEESLQDSLSYLGTKDEEYVYAPQISLVHDNVLYGSVGPVSGWRAAILFNRSFSTENNYSVFYADLRKYHFFAKKYALAFRLFGGVIAGDTNSEFNLDYFSGVRGYDEELSGKKKLVSSIELRFPFIDRLTTTFPLPLHFRSIRGSAFIDAGGMWDDFDSFKFLENGRFDDLKVGIGFGPRLNMGYFVLKLDIAWNTNLTDFSKPAYYFSLTPDF